VRGVTHTGLSASNTAKDSDELIADQNAASAPWPTDVSWYKHLEMTKLWMLGMTRRAQAATSNVLSGAQLCHA